jgi:hypothetical protein
LLKGQKKGLTLQQSIAQLHETILNCNFRSGWDQPLWQKSTGKRALTMFWMTPFKLAEYKARMITGAIKGEKDLYGTYWGAKAIRYLTVIGLAEMVARANDTSILDLAFHLPGITHKFPPDDDDSILNNYTFGASPAVDLLAEADKKGVWEGVKKHYNAWGMISKVKRIKDKDVPKMYDSSLKYLMGLKKRHWEKEYITIPRKRPSRPSRRSDG